MFDNGRYSAAAVDPTAEINTAITAAIAAAVGAPVEFVVAFSDETTVFSATGTKMTFTMLFGLTLDTDGLPLDLTAAPTGSAVQVDINVNAGTILSTKITVDATETSSDTAATPAVISSRTLAVGDVITIDLDAFGSTLGGAGGKQGFRGVRT